MPVRVRLKKGDTVRVIAGKNKGMEGTVLSVNRENGRVAVEGVNIVKKAQRPTQQNPRGGFDERESPIHVSNVQILDPQTNEPSRIGSGTDDEGRKIRVSVKSGVTLDG
ncbi:MAG: 50S ribosomal protein L24 [Trueperaceae bacterium]